MRYLIVFIYFVSVLHVTGCSSGQDQKNESDKNTKTEIAERVRPAAKDGTTAAYFVFQNTLNIADTIISVESPVAGLTQIHETYETENGMMGMREQRQVIVGPGERIFFEQGRLHVMLMQLNKSLSAGDSVSVILRFARAGTTEFRLPVQSQ